MAQKLDLLLAIWKANCDRCHNEDWLYIPISDEYGLLCEKCMNECNLEIDMEETHKNLGQPKLLKIKKGEYDES